MTLTEFLLARVAEDEAVARTAMSVSLVNDDEPWALEVDSGDRIYGATGLVTASPARVLAECAVKRAIVEACSGPASCLFDDDPDDPIEWNGEVHLAADILRHLATMYADHPDYDEAWKP